MLITGAQYKLTLNPTINHRKARPRTTQVAYLRGNGCRRRGRFPQATCISQRYSPGHDPLGTVNTLGEKQLGSGGFVAPSESAIDPSGNCSAARK